MNTIETLIGETTHLGSAFDAGLGREAVGKLAPAAYAVMPHERMSARYTFVPTASVIDEMERAGFCIIQARQSKPRKGAPEFATHALRFRKRKSEVYVGEIVPEILLLNSHDGSSAYHLKIALYRAICRNGMIVSDSSFGWTVAHRGNAAKEILAAALDLSDRFGEVGSVIERMQHTILDESQRTAFAADALRLRYPDEPAGVAVSPADLLKPEREEDVGNDVWRVLNVVQERIIMGGVPRRTATNRRVKTKGVRAIREDVRLNMALWDRATREVV